MISIDSLFLRYSSKILFNEICGNICARDRIALVGSNGAGKTTFFKVLVGLLQLDGGSIEKANFVTIGYLPQDGITVEGKTLYKEVESAFEGILSLQAKIEEASNKLYDVDPKSQEYLELLDIIGAFEHKLEDMEAHKLKSKIEKVLLGLGFSMSDMDRQCGEFSGGWQMRVALAKLLLLEPTLLLLDEPTNHLDITSQRWLENYLKKYEGALMTISHDKSFLDTLCNRTFELTMGKMYIYEGNYTFYKKESAHRKELIQKAYISQQKQIEKTQTFINRFRATASRANLVQSRIKALDKLERVELEKEESSVKFKFPEAPESGHIVLELQNASKYYNDLKVFDKVNLRIERGDRIAVVGVNGAGKTTLAKVLAGVEPFTSGERKAGHKVKISYFAQHVSDTFNPEHTVLETIENKSLNVSNINFRTILGAFLFRGDDVYKNVKVLSGGERCRLALACILVQKANCLILDEPTNHLDMRSQEMLQNALLDFKGTLLIVSHNRSFLDPLVNKVFEVSKAGIRIFLGNVSDYLEKIEATAIPEVQAKLPILADANVNSKEVKVQDKPKPQLAQNRSSVGQIKKKLTELESLISSIEKEKEALELKMVDPEFFKRGEEAREGMARHDELDKKLSAAMREWEELGKQLI